MTSSTNIKVRALRQWLLRNGPEAAIPTGRKETVYTTPLSQVRLDRFVSQLRKEFRDGTLDNEVKESLDELGFQWKVSRGPRSTVDLRSRNAQMVELRSRKMSLAEIADKFDLSRQRVHQVLKGVSK